MLAITLMPLLPLEFALGNYSPPFVFGWGVNYFRLLWFGSVYFTAKMLLNSPDDADLNPEEQSEAGHTFDGTESSDIERKDSAIASVQPAPAVESEPESQPATQAEQEK